MADFQVVPGGAVLEVLDESRTAVIDTVRSAYLHHHAGSSVNPDSYFLRFPAKPDARIIALPAYLGGDVEMAGLKWIASFPANVASGLPRASAVLILNDYATGYPIAMLEAAGISAARTAASAALAARELPGAPLEDAPVGIVGAGVIARTILDYLVAAGRTPETVWCHDRDPSSAGKLAEHARALGLRAQVTERLADAVEQPLVVFATTAPEPYVDPSTRLRPEQLVLNISLRDLPPELLLEADNVLDDVEHCLKADTSPHLTEQRTGNRDFVTGTLAGVIEGTDRLSAERGTVFSPFGLGVLDLAVGAHVLSESRRRGTSVLIPDFVGQATRW